MGDLAGMKPLKQWADEAGVSHETAKKRRQQAGVGVLLGGGRGTWFLTAKEWRVVLSTPLPGCVRAPQ